MSQPRSIALEQTFRYKFNTYQFSTGAPFTLAGTPSMRHYEDDNETQITAGLTLTVDYDSVTGLHEVECAGTAANGYEAAKHYTSHINAGTVDSISAVGVQVYDFEIEPASVLAVRQFRETIAATGTLTTQTGVSDNTAVNLTGIVDAQSANDLYNGWLGLLKDETDGQCYLCRLNDFTNTNLLASITSATGATLPTPASGDKFWLLGAAPLMPTVPGRTLDVASNGALDADSIDAVLDEAIGDSTVTFREALRLMVAALGGKASGLETATAVFRNIADDTDVITATVDADGNRTAVTLDLT